MEKNRDIETEKDKVSALYRNQTTQSFSNGGYLANLLVSLWGDLWLGLLPVYLISAGGRLVASVLFLRVKDYRKYPRKVNGLLEWFHEIVPFRRPE